MSMDFKDYNPGRFVSTADTVLGRKLWGFITDSQSLHAMEVASDLGQPAVAGIEESLLEKFEKEVLEDRIKQLIGHMIRQAMEHQGFEVEQNDVKMNSVPFSKGTRYRRPNWYTLHVFRNSKAPKELCFTNRRSGEKLPPLPGGGKWRYWSSFSTALRGKIAFGIDPKAVREEVKKQGYSLRQHKRLLRAG